MTGTGAQPGGILMSADAITATTTTEPLMPETERLGDPVPVLVMAADGPVVVWHTPEEYAALWQGVDPEICEALEEE